MTVLHPSRRSFHNEEWTRANSRLRIGAGARLRMLGSRALKFSREKFTRSGTVDFLANSCGATKAFSQGLVSGPSNGQLRGCFREPPKAFTCIHRAFQKLVIQ